MEAISVSAWTAQLTTESVLLSIGILCATLISLFLASLICPLVKFMILFFVIGLVVSVVMQIIFLSYLFSGGYISDSSLIVYGAMGMIGSGLYVMMDLILVLTPGAFDMDDYILGALMLYIDIIRAFLYILMIFG